MLAPKRVRHRKQHRPRPLKGMSKGHTQVYVGDYGLMATTPGWITARQIESARIAITRAIKRGGQVRITIFPDRSITRKPLETRMGSGKGAPDHWVAPVKPGRIMFELSGVDEELAREAMRKASHKLPVKTKFVTREEGGE
ncbi:MAG: 50S ribosomal protein L16 [Nitriliruptor sp.]|nr:MAG: 50S ribosomal protein L16 [Nitriliruptor sp.]